MSKNRKRPNNLTATPGREKKVNRNQTPINSNTSNSSSVATKAGGNALPNGAAGTFATPIWTNLGTPSLATKDVYGHSKGKNGEPGRKGDEQGIPMYQDVTNVSGIDQSIASSLKGIKSVANKLSQAVKTYNSIRQAVNNGISLDRLDGISGAIKSGLAGMGMDVKSDLFKQIESTSNYLVSVGKAVHQVKNTNWSDANSIVKLVNGLSSESSGLFNLKDISAEAKYTITLINQMTRMGIPNSLSSVSELIKGSPLLNEIVGGILPETLKAFDLETLKTMDELISGQLVKSINESFNTDLSRSFDDQIKGKYPERSDSDWFSLYKESIERIDPDAFFLMRDGEKIIDISAISEGSTYFKDMVSNGVIDGRHEEYLFLVMVKGFGGQEVRSNLTRDFPNVVWKDDIVRVPQHEQYTYY